MSNLPRFQQLQYAFAAHLRDPERNPMPEGLENRRVAIYRELFYNNVEGLLSGNFPVLRRITPDARWHALVRGFYAEHQSHTPLFPEIGREFLRYLEERAERGADDPPFMIELAHYEWVETAVAFDEQRIEDLPHDPAGDVVAGRPVLSPLAWPLAYRFPVHRIRPEFQPEQAPDQPTFLIVARNRRDEVAFIESSAATLRLIELVKANPRWSGLEAVNAIAASFAAGDREKVVASACDMLRGLCARDVILGTRTA
jgi:hypothetical protein